MLKVAFYTYKAPSNPPIIRHTIIVGMNMVRKMSLSSQLVGVAVVVLLLLLLSCSDEEWSLNSVPLSVVNCSSLLVLLFSAAPAAKVSGPIRRNV